MSELRCDPILGQWVIVKTVDSLGPDNYKNSGQPLEHEATCQFCPGREHMTPPEVGVIARVDPKTGQQEGWQVRAVSNKFPALKIEGLLDEKRDGMYLQTDGIGAHEVVIETPAHYQNLTDLSDAEMISVLKIYKERVVDLSKDKRFKYIVVFKNYGESAGTTVEHAHSQIIALPMIPKYVQQEIDGAKKYFDTNKNCVFCDMINQEQADKSRLITQNEDFISFCPYVPRYPFESWILPLKHQSEFSEISVDEQTRLALILKETLLRIKRCLNNPSYNFYLHIAPINEARPESYHWHVEIVPKLSSVSGFEWGTGVYVVSTDPDQAASYLRNVAL